MDPHEEGSQLELSVYPGEILIASDFDRIIVPESDKFPILEMSVIYSINSEYDIEKIEYLVECGIDFARTWAGFAEDDIFAFTFEENKVAAPLRHAEIVTTTIIMENMKEIFSAIINRAPPEEFEKLIRDREKILVENRVNRTDERLPDIHGIFRNNEEWLRSQNIICNLQARVSPEELRELVILVLDSFKR